MPLTAGVQFDIGTLQNLYVDGWFLCTVPLSGFFGNGQFYAAPVVPGWGFSLPSQHAQKVAPATFPRELRARRPSIPDGKVGPPCARGVLSEVYVPGKDGFLFDSCGCSRRNSARPSFEAGFSTGHCLQQSVAEQIRGPFCAFCIGLTAGERFRVRRIDNRGASTQCGMELCACRKGGAAGIDFANFHAVTGSPAGSARCSPWPQRPSAWGTSGTRATAPSRPPAGRAPPPAPVGPAGAPSRRAGSRWSRPE